MNPSNEISPASATHVDHIPVIWIAPEQMRSSTRLAIWLPPGTGAKEDTLPYLAQLAGAGFLAVSFDSWLHGERGTGKSAEEMFALAMADFANTIWPIVGLSAMDAMRVIDWALAEFAISPPCCMGGVSLGGDIAVAAAGIEARIGIVSAIIATPDWSRPGMNALGRVVSTGPAGRYAQFFYDRINPLTNLGGFSRCPAITFECGAEDDHVPPDGALRFQEALRPTYASTPDRLRVNLHPGAGHQVTPAMWQNSLEWFRRH